MASFSRAYALLHVKAVDADTRTITGVATTPQPDRVGDVVEPKGLTFSNPTPLLLHHDTTRPVGLVRFGIATASGLPFTATLPAIDPSESRVLAERIDEAWASIKAGLIFGVSIGFRALKDGVERIRSGGLRFTSAEVLELSLVTIPANASAVIDTIKSLDRAAIGNGERAVHLSGASDLTDRRNVRMKTYAEQITALENKRAATTARMDTIVRKAIDEGRSTDEAEASEFDTAKAEVEKIDADLVRLKALDEFNRQNARPVDGADPASAAASRGSVVVLKGMNDLPPGIEFARYVMCLATAKGMPDAALSVAKERYPDQARIQTTLKAAVSAGTTTDPAWAGSLVDYQQFAGDFINFLRPATIVGKFGQGNVPSLRRVPFNVKIGRQTGGGQGYWVGEGAPKPLTKFAFDTVTLRWAKVANIAVLTEELVRFSSPSAEQTVRDALAEAIIARIDTDFVAPAKAAVADVSPASITNGVAPIVSAGGTAANIRTDIQALFAPYIAVNQAPERAVWIMGSATALALSLMQNALGQADFPGITMQGGTFNGLPVIVSQYAAGLVILANADDIYLADDGQVVVDASREASLQMLDDPTNHAGTATPTNVVSMFQTNSIALRAERFINWARRRAEAVQYIAGVTWGAAA